MTNKSRHDTRRVLFLTPSLGGGGAEHQAVVLAAELHRRGTPVGVVTARASGPYMASLLPDTPVHETDAPVWCGSTLAALMSIRAVVRVIRSSDEPVTLIPVLEIWWLVSKIAELWAKTGNGCITIPYVQNVPLGLRHKPPWRERVVFTLGWMALRRSHSCLVLCDQLAETVRSMTPPGYDVAVVPNAVDERVQPLKLDRRLPQLHLLFIGRLVSQKRPDRFLEVVERLRQYVPNVYATLVGDGPMRAQVESNAGRDVDFTGWLDEPWTVALRGRPVLVLTSDFEGFGSVIVEAMAAGIPVVASDCPTGPSDILSGSAAGFLCPPADVDAYVSHLREMLPLPAYEAASAAAILDSKKYCVSQVADKFVAAVCVEPWKERGRHGAERDQSK